MTVKRRLLAILVCVCMLSTIFPLQVLAQDKASYVALGDSITTGYGLIGDAETNKNINSFAAKVARTNNLDLTNLAEDGETSASLLDKLTNTGNLDYSTVTEAIKTADVITITIGGNDLMDALYEYLATRNSSLGTADQIAEKLAKGEFNALELYLLIGSIQGFDPSNALSTFESNLPKIINAIQDINADVPIVVTTQYDPYGHIDTSSLDGSIKSTIELVLAVFTSGVQALNDKIKVQNAGYTVADVYSKFEERNTSSVPLCNARFAALDDYNLDFHPNADGHKVIADVVGDAMKIVTGVTVSPQQIVLAPGETEKFSAEVSGVVSGINVDQQVTWEVSGNSHTGTTIGTDGTLTIDNAETATTLTVKATSVEDPSKSGTATVTVGEKAEIYVGGVGLNGTPTAPAYATTDTDGKVNTSGADESKYNIKWDGTTLTLNGATIKNTGVNVIYREGSLDIVLQGTNTVESHAQGNEASYGIYVDGDMQVPPTSEEPCALSISGDGSLEVSGSASSGSNAGIATTKADIKIQSGTITAIGGNTDGGNSAGIMTNAGDVIISGGTVNATGGAANDASAGIYAMRGDVTISGGEVTAAAEYGAGITAMKVSQSDLVPGNITISPVSGQQIVVMAGANEAGAAALQGSPFMSETAIQGLIQNAAYVHTAAEQAPVTKYTITFDANGGSVAPASAETTDGKLVSLPTPGYAGHIFQGWFTAATGGTQVTTDTVFTADATIYAQWKAESSTPTTPTGPGKPAEPDGPATEDSEGWSAIEDELASADDGDDIAVDMNGATEVPKEVFERVAGKDVDVTFELEDGVSWSVNGADIPTDADLSDLDLGVTMDSDGIPVDVIDAVTSENSITVQMTLAHDGAFGFTMTLSAPLGKENAGRWANLYHYNEALGRMDFEVAVKIDDDGNAKLPMSHASQYAIVIDDHSHAAEEPSALPFTDVNADDWFSDVVRYVYEQGLMTGTSDREFSPNLTTTRGMIVSILNRLEDGPTAEAAGFTDVADGDWYAEAVNWAASEGIVNGFEDNTFRPNDPITREQLAAMLMNYAAWKGEDVSARADLSGYNDAASVSSWAAKTVQWAVAEGLINGMPGNLLEPQGSATRAQVAAILQRFLSD